MATPIKPTTSRPLAEGLVPAESNRPVHSPSIDQAISDRLKYFRLATGRPTVFCSSNWLQNPRFTGDVELSFLRSYRETVKRKEHEASQIKLEKPKKHVRNRSDGNQKIPTLKGLKQTRRSVDNLNSYDEIEEEKLGLNLPFLHSDRSSPIQTLSHFRTNLNPKKIDMFNLPSDNERHMIDANRALGNAFATFSHLKDPALLLQSPQIPRRIARTKQLSLTREKLKVVSSPEKLIETKLDFSTQNDKSAHKRSTSHGQTFRSLVHSRRNSQIQRETTKSKVIPGEDLVLEAAIKKLEIFKTFTRKGKNQKSDIFESFRTHEKALKDSKFLKLNKKKRQDLVQHNLKVDSKWMVDRYEKSKQHSEAIEEKSKLALFERERKTLTRKIAVVLKSKNWDIGKNIGEAIRIEKYQRGITEGLVKNWINLFMYLRILPAIKEKQVLYKIVDIFKKARQVKFERVITFAKKVVPKRLLVKRHRDMALAGSCLRLQSRLFKADGIYYRAKDTIGYYLFRKLRRPLEAKMMLNKTHQVLTRMTTQCIKFVKRVRFYKQYVKERWVTAKSEILGDDTTSSTPKLVHQLEQSIWKLIYDYYDCSRVTDLMVNQKIGKTGSYSSMIFNPDKLFNCFIKRENKTVADIVIECIKNEISQTNKEESRGTKKPKQDIVCSQTNDLIPTLPRGKSISKLRLKGKVSPNSSLGIFQHVASAGTNTHMENSPFSKFDLLRHVNNRLMTSIQRSVIDKTAAIRASIVMQGRNNYR